MNYSWISQVNILWYWYHLIPLQPISNSGHCKCLHNQMLPQILEEMSSQGGFGFCSMLNSLLRVISWTSSSIGISSHPLKSLFFNFDIQLDFKFRQESQYWHSSVLLTRVCVSVAASLRTHGICYGNLSSLPLLCFSIIFLISVPQFYTCKATLISQVSRCVYHAHNV